VFHVACWESMVAEGNTSHVPLAWSRRTPSLASHSVTMTKMLHVFDLQQHADWDAPWQMCVSYTPHINVAYCACCIMRHDAMLCRVHNTILHCCCHYACHAPGSSLMFHTDHDIAWQDARFRHANMLLDDIPCCRGLVMSLNDDSCCTPRIVLVYVIRDWVCVIAQVCALIMLISMLVSITPADLVVDI